MVRRSRAGARRAHPGGAECARCARLCLSSAHVFSDRAPTMMTESLAEKRDQQSSSLPIGGRDGCRITPAPLSAISTRASG